MKKGLLLAVLVMLVLFLVPGVAMAEYTNDLCTDPSKGICSSYYGTTNTPDKAYDNNFTGNNGATAWEAGTNTLPQWVGYDFTLPTSIKKYTITQGYSTNTPTTWTFQGSNDAISWVDLQQVSDQPTWSTHETRAFTFNNTSSYRYYRIYITAVEVAGRYPVINEIEMMGEEGTATPSAPTNLSATAGDEEVALSWDLVTGADTYSVKRATTSGGPYTEIETDITTTSYTDTAVTNGITYYYVVTAVNTGGESGISNEASATPSEGTPPSGNDALLVVTMTNGMEKEYQLSSSDVNSFISWYNGRAGGSGNAYYIISKSYNLGPFSTRKDYIVFDKILCFEVMEY